MNYSMVLENLIFMLDNKDGLLAKKLDTHVNAVKKDYYNKVINFLIFRNST
jgi:hypothetical protein